MTQYVTIEPSSSSAFDWLHQVFSPVDVTNWTVLRRSAAVPNSLASSVVSIGQICFRMWLCNMQSCRTWAGVWSAIRQSHIEDSAMPIFFRCALNPQCPVRKRKIVLCSGRLRLFKWSWWGLQPSVFCVKFTFQRCFITFLASRYDILVSGCGSLVPSFARLSAFSFPLMPQWAGIHCAVVVAVLASWFKICLSLSVTSSVGVDCRVCSAEIESDRKTIFVGISLS